MSSSQHFTIMSLEQANKEIKKKVVTQYFTYFTISQIVSGKQSLYFYPENLCVYVISQLIIYYMICCIRLFFLCIFFVLLEDQGLPEDVFL